VEGLGQTKWLLTPSSENATSQPPFQQRQLYPCTALCVLLIIEEYHIRQHIPTSKLASKSQTTALLDTFSLHQPSDEWKNQTVSVINRSEILGRLFAVMMARKGATVYSIDIDSILQFHPHGRVHRCNPATNTLSIRQLILNAMRYEL
jgi:5,10-methylene-tetrahydrofolate dehydrogenase/methenyl tetrahydrofolate cyclohydrolase